MELQVKRGPTVTVEVDDQGHPLCPHCCEVMVQVDHDRYACPDTAFAHALLEEWARALEQELAAWERDLIGSGEFRPTGLLSALSEPPLWPARSGLDMKWPDCRRTALRGEYVPSVDWDAALRQLTAVAW